MFISQSSDAMNVSTVQQENKEDLVYLENTFV